ncbi:MAG: NAD+ synthase [Candidatus Peregrinibacteria bacterium]
MTDKFNKLVEGLRKFMRSAGKTRAVLGLSGGVDSALVAKIAVEALGKENVTALNLPNLGLSSPEHMKDAEEWAKALGIQYITVPINPFFEVYGKLQWKPSVIAGMNINCRIRMSLLYHFANSHDAVVLGTGNKSELSLGYFTKYGDGACDVEVIGSLYKTDVWKMSKAVGVPQKIYSKIPSAELAPGQTDEGEMGFSYREADEIMRAMERGETPTGKVADKIRGMMKTNRHKSALPPTL